MFDLPLGYLVTVTLMAVCTLIALAPPRPRHSIPSNLSLWFSYVLNEVPFVAFYYLLASTVLAFVQDDIGTPGGWAVFGLAALTMVGLIVVAWRGGRQVLWSIRRSARAWAMGCVRGYDRGCPTPGSCSRRSWRTAAMLSAWRTFATATRASKTCSISTVIGRIHQVAPRSSICTAAHSAAAEKTARCCL